MRLSRTPRPWRSRLRPYPQFSDVTSLWAPLGNSWYDSLQIKATKRYSHGLDFTAAYTYSKTLSTVEAHDGTIVPLNDVYNRPNLKTLSSSDQPHVFVVGFNYQTPKVGSNKFVKALVGDWTIGGILRYSSGFPIRVPQAQNAINSVLFRGGSNANRVANQPLFLKDPNCHCFDPNKEFILNPNAWSDPLPGEWGTAASYYSDYRTARRPDEQLSLGRVFRHQGEDELLRPRRVLQRLQPRLPEQPGFDQRSGHAARGRQWGGDFGLRSRQHCQHVQPATQRSDRCALPILIAGSLIVDAGGLDRPPASPPPSSAHTPPSLLAPCFDKLLTRMEILAFNAR